MTAPYRPAGVTEPVGLDDLLEFFSDTMTFVPGHQLRSVRCVRCGVLIGGRPFKVHQVVRADTSACTCGGLAGTVYLVCAEHAGDDDAECMTAAITRAGNHHGQR